MIKFSNRGEPLGDLQEASHHGIIFVFDDTTRNRIKTTREVRNHFGRVPGRAVPYVLAVAPAIEGYKSIGHGRGSSDLWLD
ncbi:hypothetical protein [Desulfosporosinus fructosivorans]|uniref:hypothetical protein n=1 Tax=Desulfosporosinus fructosivorans TaxID=2018669 RepID=UPI00130E9FCC|nr:hypothetical protein [Desulfosporosinus fructosivorans]